MDCDQPYRYVKAEEIFAMIKHPGDGVIDKPGQIILDFGGIRTPITMTDIVGGLLQNWLDLWLSQNRIYHHSPSNSQEFPDFYLEDGTRENLLELKTFQYFQSPAFDLANFYSYCTSLIESPWKLDAKYLILGYHMDNETGLLTIKDAWLRHIWEIAGPGENRPLNIQVKQKAVYNIRPRTWFSRSGDGETHKNFTSREDFLTAIRDTLNNFPLKDGMPSSEWLSRVNSSYADWKSQTK